MVKFRMLVIGLGRSRRVEGGSRVGIWGVREK